MDSNGQKKSKNKTLPWIFTGIVVVSLIVLVVLQSSGFWQNFSDETVNSKLLLYALSSVNFIAFIIFAFILLRSLIKLSRERRTFQIGAKIKTRLLLYFIGLSILPIIAMAFFSYLFMNRALERWFTQIPQKVVLEAAKVKNLRQNEIASMLAKLLEEREVTNQKLTQVAEAGNLLFLEVLSPKNEVLAHSEKKIEPQLQEKLNQRLTQSEVISVYFSDGRRLVMVPDFRPENELEKTIDSSLDEFESLKQQEVSVRQLGLTILGLLTFLLIFASTWVALHLSRSLTVPIKALAEGADEIGQGNLAHRVKAAAEDELALLVDVFNKMSAALEANSIERHERRKYIETVLETLSTGVISFDSDDRISTINKAAVQILRLEDKNFIGVSLSELVGEENRTILEKLINRAKRIGQASEQTVLQRETSNGNLEAKDSVPAALTVSAFPDKKGVVLVIEDLTELLQAQRASAWQEVARRMAHEIKNPLTPIQLSAERIAKRIVRSSQTDIHATNSEEQNVRIVKEGTDTIIREVSFLKSMVDEFSRFARLPNVKLEAGSLNDLIKQTVFYIKIAAWK